MISEKLEIMVRKIRQLPEERQAAAIEALEVIVAQRDIMLTDAEIQGVKQAQDAVGRGEYASDEDVRSFFGRFRA